MQPTLLRKRTLLAVLAAVWLTTAAAPAIG